MKILQKCLILTCTALITACSSIGTNHPADYLSGPPVKDTKTPYSDQLTCIGHKVEQYHDNRRFVITADYIADKTGKINYNTEGYQVTQGAEDMVMSALAKSDSYILVERLNLNIPKMEITMANDYLLSDLNPEKNVYDKAGHSARALYMGEIIGSDYIIVGSISEVNFNTHSSVYELFVDGIGGGWRTFWMDVGMDLRVVDTTTTRVVKSLPLRKQIWGYENRAGVIRFFGETFVNGYAGQMKQEPIQLAVRSIIEGAVVEITRDLYNLPEDVCSTDLDQKHIYSEPDMKDKIKGIDKEEARRNERDQRIKDAYSTGGKVVK